MPVNGVSSAPLVGRQDDSNRHVIPAWIAGIQSTWTSVLSCILDPGTNPPGADLDARSAGRSPDRRDGGEQSAGDEYIGFDMTD